MPKHTMFKKVKWSHIENSIQNWKTIRESQQTVVLLCRNIRIFTFRKQMRVFFPCFSPLSLLIALIWTTPSLIQYKRSVTYFWGKSYTFCVQFREESSDGIKAISQMADRYQDILMEASLTYNSEVLLLLSKFKC